MFRDAESAAEPLALASLLLPLLFCDCALGEDWLLAASVWLLGCAPAPGGSGCGGMGDGALVSSMGLLWLLVRAELPVELSPGDGVVVVALGLLMPVSWPYWLLAGVPAAVDESVAPESAVPVSVSLRAHPAKQIRDATITANFFIVSFVSLIVRAARNTAGVA